MGLATTTIPQPIELRKAFLVLVDISGYTKFVKLHRYTIVHAEMIISELLQTIVDNLEEPLVINKFGGDSALLVGATEDPSAMALKLFQQIQGFFTVFRRRERELVSECSLCDCEACSNADLLALKVIAGYGDVVFKQIGKFEEVAGEEVILLHRLLKNSIQEREYLLITESLYQLAGHLIGERPRFITERCEGIGQAKVALFFPQSGGVEPKQTRWQQKIWRFLSMEAYALKRIAFKVSRPYDNLPRRQAN